MKPLATALCALVCAAPLTILWSRAHSAQTHALAELANTQRIEEQLRELAELERQPSTIAPSREDDQALVARLTSACTAAGIPQHALTSVAPGAESPADPRLNTRSQDASVTLDGVSLPHLGRFLDHWRTNHPAWRIVGLEASPHSATTRDGAATPLRIQLSLRTTFLAPESNQ